MRIKTGVIMICIVATLLIACSLPGCKETEIEQQEEYRDFLNALEHETLDGLRLKIYYLNPGILTRAPLTVDDLIQFPGVNEIIIDSKQLKNHTDLLSQINGEHLRPVANPARVHARMCYIFETDNAGEIMVIAFSGIDNSVFVNDIEVEFDNIFRDVIKPYLTDEVMNDLEYIFNGQLKIQ